MTLRRCTRAGIQTAILLACSSIAFAQTPAAPPQSSATATPEPAAPTPRFWQSSDPNAQLTVLEDTPIHVMTNGPISTAGTHAGDQLFFTLTEDIGVGEFLVIPRGATIHGEIVQSKASGALAGSPSLILKLTSLDLEGHTYPLYSYQFRVTGTARTRQTLTNVAGGAAIGGIVADIHRARTEGDTTTGHALAQAGKGAAIGAGAGLAISAAQPGPIVQIPAESQLDFYLAAPLSVIPVSPHEAKRLAGAVRPGGPILYVRGETP